MNSLSGKFLRTDFGHEVYDEWYLGLERSTWLKIDMETQKHYKCAYSQKHLPADELKNCLVEAGFMDFHFYKKRSLEDFHPENDNGFSLVARK
ncbi:hypothetical protein F4Y93_10130 [Candidatus Poribacteria bacterium]|nr:hypothetical protein [Candidatus Poribacteria bacterium]